ncbi:hypothetical protein Cgig2_028356 [Carnegiea gigantea]|uniref:F-box associated domain-containing protein n=1 Tax=Carnegiea gigantea TaxID=171969 RepID=A0A9Q1K1P8_9CARY|nr:hypothetical protein Cgig2_028356 [Carnegiea gigantea]
MNPITKECRNVPFPEPNYHQRFLGELCWAYGFGFVPAIHDFKLVLLLRQHSRPYKWNNRVHIFSLREDKWRELDIPSDVLEFLEASLVHHSLYPHLKAIHEVVLLNDAFYSAASFASGDMGEFFVLKFDIAKETFSTLSNLKQMDGYPRGNCKYYCRELSTGVNEHDNVCVCQLLFTTGARFVVQMWMLEEQRQEGDWKLTFRIGLESQFSKKFPRLNDNILIKISDGQEHQVWLLDPSQYPPTYKIVMKKNVVYVKDFVASLISPHCDFRLQDINLRTDEKEAVTSST